MVKKSLFFSLFFLSAFILYAQQYKSVRYGDLERLPVTRITSLLEDRIHGYLWIGMYGGVARFDGKEFEIYTESEGLLNSIVTNLFQDSRGTIWIATAKGISKHEDGQFKNYFKKFSPISKLTEFQDTLIAIHSSQGRNFTLIVTGDSLQESPQGFLPEKIMDAEAVGGSLYLISRDFKLYRKTAKGIKELKQFVHHSFFISVDDVLYLKSGPSIFSLTEDSVLSVMDTKYKNRIISSPADFFLATYGNKLFNNPDGDESTALHPTSFCKDSEGQLWIGTENQGLFKYYEPAFEKLDGPTSSAGEVLSMEEDNQGRLWVGTANEGVNIYHNDRLVKHLSFDKAGKNRIRDISRDNKGYLWVATRNGVGKINSNDFSSNWFFEDRVIKRVEFGMKDNLWIAFEDGSIGFLVNGVFTEIANNNILQGWVWDIKYWSEKNLMFICTDAGQLFQLGEDILLSQIEIPGLSNSILLTTSFHKNTIIVASTGNGIAQIDINNPAHINYYSKENGLSSDLITFAKTDGTGLTWIGSLLGLNALTNDSTGNNVRITQYGREAGLNNLRANCAVPLKDYWYFGFPDGLYKFKGNSSIRKKEFPLHLEKVIEHKNGVILKNLKEPLTLNYLDNNLTFYFKKVSKSNAGQTKYRYLLNGARADSSYSALPDGKIEMIALSPGNHKLLVQASNEAGQFTDEVIYEFQLTPPYYQTWWFRIALFILLIVFGLILFYLRMKWKVKQALLYEQIRKEQTNKIRKVIGQDFHDEMGNQLARIINYVGALRFGNGTNRDEILEKTEHTAKYLLTGTKDFVWAIDPVNDNLQSLFFHIRDFGEKLLSEKFIAFRAYYHVDGNPLLPPGFTRQINLIFKEAITNCFKHSQATKAELQVIRQDELIYISLTDNGVGLIEKNNDDSLEGLANMRRRASKIASDLKIENLSSGGLSISLKIKL